MLKKNKKRAGVQILPNFKTSYKATVGKAVWFGRNSRHKGWRIEPSPEINPHKDRQRIFHTGPKNMQEKRVASSTNE